MWLAYAEPDNEACVSPPVTQAAKYNAHHTEAFGSGDAATNAALRLQLHRPHTSTRAQRMLDHTFHGDSSPSTGETRHRRCSASADAHQRGKGGVMLPITAGIRPPSNRQLAATVPSLVAEDAFNGLLPKLPTSANTSVTSNGVGEGGNGAQTVKNTSYASPSTSASSRPSSQQCPSTASPSPAMMYSNESNPYAAAVAAAPGRLSEVQPTLRGVATTGHPAAARNTLPIPNAPSGGVQGSAVTPSTSMAYTNVSANGLPRQESLRVGAGGGMPAMAMNGMSGMQNMLCNQFAYPHMMSGAMNLHGGGGSNGGNGNAHPNTMNMGYAMQPSYMGGYLSNAPLPTSSYQQGSLMGYSMGNATASMYSSHNNNNGLGGYGSNTFGSGYTNNNNNNMSSGGPQFSMSQPNAFYPGMQMQSQMGSHGLEGNVYGSMRGVSPGNNGGTMVSPQLPFQQHYAAPGVGQRNGSTNSGKSRHDGSGSGAPKKLYPSSTAPSFSTPQGGLSKNNHQQSMASLTSRTQSLRGGNKHHADDDLFMQSVNTEVLGVPDARPVSEKGQRSTASKRKENARSSDWLSASPSPTNKAALFSAEERVRHERRPSGYSSVSPDPDIPRLPSRRSTSAYAAQRRVSAVDPPSTRRGSESTSSRPGFLRRFTDQCNRIGRTAASGLRGRGNGEKRRRRPRKPRDGSTAEAKPFAGSSRASSSRASFVDDNDDGYDEEDEYEDERGEDRSFDSSMDTSGEDERDEGQRKGHNSSTKPGGAVNSRSGGGSSTDAAVTIAQRRRVRVKSLDAGVIDLAIQGRK